MTAFDVRIAEIVDEAQDVRSLLLERTGDGGGEARRECFELVSPATGSVLRPLPHA